MNENQPFLVLELACDQAVDWLVGRVRQAGLVVRCTFDLQVARISQNVCPCPHHGTDQCDCQMMVLLVYQPMQSPITIVAHGNSNRTCFSMVDNPQQRADPKLEASIRAIVTTLHPASLPLEINQDTY